MADILNFDSKDTLLRLALNGDKDKILEFDPGDVNTRRKFYNMKDSMITKQQELDSKIKQLDLKEEDGIQEAFKLEEDGIQEAFKLEEDFFDYLKDLIDDIFGNGATNMICGNRKNVFVLANCIIALCPYFEKFRNDTKNKYTSKLKDAGVL